MVSRVAWLKKGTQHGQNGAKDRAEVFDYLFTYFVYSKVERNIFFLDLYFE